MEDAADSIIDSVRSVHKDIEYMLNENRDQWESYLSAARSTITSIDEVDFFSLTDRLAEQRWIVQVLQDYAYHDSDYGSIQDIADWCQASWLRILQDHPDDVNTLAGLFLPINDPFSSSCQGLQLSGLSSPETVYITQRTRISWLQPLILTLHP
jgi:hypothetical protein